MANTSRTWWCRWTLPIDELRSSVSRFRVRIRVERLHLSEGFCTPPCFERLVQETLIWAYLKDKSLSLLVCCLKQITSPPTDGISSLSFSPKANYLVATSWDNQVLHLACMQYVLLTLVF